MTRTLPLILYSLGIFAACWLGGRIPVAPLPIEPGGEIYSIFIERALPHASQLLVSLLILGAYLIALIRFGVLLLPHPRLTFLAMAVTLVFAFSAGSSAFKHDAAAEFLRWIVYFGAFFSGTVLLGRERGVHTVATVFFAGICLVAAGGVYEYAQTAPSAPNWRIMAGWQNPNAAAGLFAIGIPVGFSLLLYASNRRHLPNARSVLVLLGSGCGLVLVALWLTASKGGMLSAAIGIAASVAIALAHAGAKRSRLTKGWTFAALIPVVTAALILAAAYLPAAKRGAPTNRVFSAGTEAEQSVGFRQRLWKDTFGMAKSHPTLGVGLGGFGAAFPRYASTQGSAVAHNSYLQLAAEVGFVGLAALVAFVGAWLFSALKRHPASPPFTDLLRAGLLGGVFTGGANAFLESTFSYFGLGVILFALMGMCLALSPDGARTERLPFSARAIVGISAIGVVGWYFAAVTNADVAIGRSLSYLSSGDGDNALKELSFASGSSIPYSAPLEARARVFIARSRSAAAAGEIAQATKDAYAATDDLENAIRVRPTASVYALLGDAYALTPDKSDAQAAYGNAVMLAPSSPIYKRRLFEFFKNTGETSRARATALELVASESSDWFRLNALPWVVSTDTVGARLFLSRLALEGGDDEEAIRLLEGAFDKLADYRTKTYAELMRITGGEFELREAELAGQSVAKAEQKFAELEEIAAMLEELYAKVGDQQKKSIIRRRVEALRAIGN